MNIKILNLWDVVLRFGDPWIWVPVLLSLTLVHLLRRKKKVKKKGAIFQAILGLLVLPDPQSGSPGKHAPSLLFYANAACTMDGTLKDTPLHFHSSAGAGTTVITGYSQLMTCTGTHGTC
jgi:hypothetical protein